MEKSYIRKLLVIGVIFLFLGASATLGVSARAWADNFDTYTNGQVLDGGSDDGGWKGWGNDPTWGSTVTNAMSRSSPNSLRVEVNSDTVHEYDGYTSGQWIYTAWMYIPTDFAGESYFILLSAYDDAGATNTWAVQVHFRSEDDLVVSDFNGETAPIIYGEWVEFRCEIDLDADWLEMYYDNVFLAEHAWTDTVQGTGGGQLDIAAVDLFANAASVIYYDDISLLPPGEELVCDAGGPYNGEINVAVQFTGFASGGQTPYTWAWDFGDGDTAAVQNPTHAYDTAGTYTATLTVTDAASTVATDTATVTIVAPQPVLEIGTVTGGFGSVKASVKNTGEGAATNVAWTITLDGKLIFLGKSAEGTIATLAPAGEEAIKSGFIFGIGKTNIVISATCDEGKTAEVTKTALVLGPFVLKVA